jgi:hypothetical protein
MITRVSGVRCLSSAIEVSRCVIASVAKHSSEANWIAAPLRGSQ